MFQSDTQERNGALSFAIQRAQPYAAAARAPSTLRVYRRSWGQWTEWCRLLHTEPLPAKPEAVAACLAELARAGRSVSNVNVVLSAILFNVRAAGHTLDRKHPAIAAVTAGIARRNARPIRRAAPLDIEDLRTLIRSIGDVDLRALRDQAIVLVAFFGALRRSEIVALDVAGRSPIEIRAEGLLLHLTGTKASLSTERVALPRRADALCPVAALEKYLAATALHTGSVFRAISKSGRVLERRLDATSVRHILQRQLKAAGDGSADGELAARLKHLSPHSLRAGFVTAAAKAGAPEYLIQRTSRHKSVEVLRSYIRGSNAFAESAAAFI